MLVALELSQEVLRSFDFLLMKNLEWIGESAAEIAKIASTREDILRFLEKRIAEKLKEPDVELAIPRLRTHVLSLRIPVRPTPIRLVIVASLIRWIMGASPLAILIFGLVKHLFEPSADPRTGRWSASSGSLTWYLLGMIELVMVGILVYSDYRASTQRESSDRAALEASVSVVLLRSIHHLLPN